MVDTPPVPLRKGEATRRDFLKAGEIVFARVGYVKAEVAAVIAEAGRARGTFYVHFKDKADLLRALIAVFQMELQAAGLRKEQPFDATPSTFLNLLWTTYRDHTGTFRALVQAAAVDEDFAQLYADLRSYVRRDIGAMMAAASNTCGRIDPTTASFATALETMIVNAMYDSLAAPTLRTASASNALTLNTMIAIVERCIAAHRQDACTDGLADRTM